MGSDKKQGETYLNYVVPKKYGDANGFQAGSTFKAFVLAAAIEQGIPLDHARSTRRSPMTSTQAELRELPRRTASAAATSGRPQNSTGSGTFNIYTGTQLSVNTFFAQLEEQTGVCEPYQLAKEMGVDLTDPQTAERVPSFTLGVADASPLEMAEAYATFAARGLHCDSRPVTAIDGRRRQRRSRTTPSSATQVMPPIDADAVNDILRGVQEPGGFGYDAGTRLDQPSAGKTGTTSDSKAVWFVGYTPHLATAAMIAGANDDGHADHAGRPDRRRHLHLRGVTAPTSPARCGATRCRPSRTSSRRRLRRADAETSRASPTVPSTPGMSVDGRGALAAAGFSPTAAATSTAATPRHRRLHPPSGGSDAAAARP